MVHDTSLVKAKLPNESNGPWASLGSSERYRGPARPND
jgi:hypothetical protein